ncbi:MAG: redox-regulated ATPase YchF [Planctomycetes bacterium]|nr:redox-regulated ATPase YchF [Planctomycetota bacterium]
MKTAIIGLPQSGKTTLAGAVTSHVPDAGTLARLHQAVVKVPDERLHFLRRLYNSKRLTEATIEFIDVPGFSLADHRGHEGLRTHLPLIRQSDLLVVVLRAFEDPSVPAYRDRVDPKADLQELHDELIFSDLETITNRLERLEKALKKPTKDHDAQKHEQKVLSACNEAIEQSKPLADVLAHEDDRRIVGGMGLLTPKPLLAIFNVSEGEASAPDPDPPPGARAAMNISAAAELEISTLDSADRDAFLKDLGVETPARNRLIRKCYEMLGLISFLTVGPTDARAWTLPAGTDALTAAGKIHSDMARGFIRAETVAFSDLSEAGDMKTARAAGKVRQEGKTYIVQDGDVIYFKFNV